MCLFAFCRDGKLRAWNTVNRQFIKAIDLVSFQSHQELPLPFETGHFIKLFDLAVNAAPNPNFTRETVSFKVMVYLNLPSNPEFVILTGRYGNDGQLSLEIIQRIPSSAREHYNLVDFTLYKEHRDQNVFTCYSLWEAPDKTSVAYTFPVILSSKTQVLTEPRWISVYTRPQETLDSLQFKSVENYDFGCVEYVCEPGRFCPDVIRRTLPKYNSTLPLKQQIQHHVGSLTRADEEGGQVEMQSTSWKIYLKQLLQANKQSMAPSSITFHPNIGCAVIHHRGGAVGYLRNADSSELFLSAFSSVLTVAPVHYLPPALHSPLAKSHVRDIQRFIDLAAHIKEYALSEDSELLIHEYFLDPSLFDTEISSLASVFYERFFIQFEHESTNQEFQYRFASIENPILAAEWLVGALSSIDRVPEQTSHRIMPELLASCLRDISKSRFELTLNLFLVGVCIENYFVGPKFPAHFMSQLFNILVAYAKIIWIAKHTYIAHEKEDNIVDRFAVQSLENHGSEMSLLGYIFQNNVFVNGGNQQLTNGLPMAALELVRRLGMVEKPTDSTTYICSVLIHGGQFSSALTLLETLPPSSKQVQLLAQTHLSLNNFEKSRVYFEKATDLDRRTIITFYMDKDVDDMVIHFARLAYTEKPDENLAKTIFTHCLKIDDCEGAYNAIMLVNEVMY
jgi:Nucleoporin Nup120/160